MVELIFIVGLNTTNSAWTEHLINHALHPEWSKKISTELFEKINNRRDSSVKVPTGTQINHLMRKGQLPIAKAVRDENLRYSTPVPFLSRYIKNGFEKNGIRVPPDTTLIIPLREFNLSEEVYGEDASVYNPERFLKDTTIGRQREASLKSKTFGSPPHVCRGMHIARLVLHLMSTILCRDYSIKPQDRKSLEKIKRKLGGFAQYSPMPKFIIKPKK